MAVSTNRPRLLVPGLKPSDPYLETYVVRPGGATVLTLRPDDRVTLVDREGGAGRLLRDRTAGRCARRGGRRAAVGPVGGGPAVRAEETGRPGAPSPAGRPAPGLPRRPRHGPELRGEGRRVHPDHRRRGPAVLRLPRLPPPQVGGGARAR